MICIIQNGLGKLFFSKRTSTSSTFLQELGKKCISYKIISFATCVPICREPQHIGKILLLLCTRQNRNAQTRSNWQITSNFLKTAKNSCKLLRARNHSLSTGHWRFFRKKSSLQIWSQLLVALSYLDWLISQLNKQQMVWTENTGIEDRTNCDNVFQSLLVLMSWNFCLFKLPDTFDKYCKRAEMGTFQMLVPCIDSKKACISSIPLLEEKR